MEFIISQILRDTLGLKIKLGVIKIQMVLLVGLDDITEGGSIDRQKKRRIIMD